MNDKKIRAAIKSRINLAIVAAVCVIIATVQKISAVSEDELVAFWGTLVATFVGVGAAALLNVYLFYFQEGSKDRNRAFDAAHSLIGEFYVVLDILNAKPNIHVPDPSNPLSVTRVVTAHLEPTATEEALRLGVLADKPNSSVALSQISSFMREYSKASERLIQLVDSGSSLRAHVAARDVDRIKKNLNIWIQPNIQYLISKGVQAPRDTRFRSNPGKTISYSQTSNP